MSVATSNVIDIEVDEDASLWLRDILSFTWKNWGDFKSYVQAKGLNPPPEEIIDELSEALPEE